MRVLGIDPALAGPTGFGVVETEGRNFRAVHFGALRAAPRGARKNGHGSRANGNGHAAHGAPALKDTPAERLSEIHQRVARLLDEYEPHAVALEGIFAALNVKTALKLAEVRGVVLLAAAQRGLPVHTYSPREVKLSVTGYGHAGKQQMQQMVRAQLGLGSPQQSAALGADAADALAVALCHIHCMQARARLAAAPVGQTSRSVLPKVAEREMETPQLAQGQARAGRSVSVTLAPPVAAKAQRAVTRPPRAGINRSSPARIQLSR